MKTHRLPVLLSLGIIVVLGVLWLAQYGLSRRAVETLLNESENIHVNWREGGLLRFRAVLYPREGVGRLPVEIVINALPKDQDGVLTALSWLPDTVTSFSIDVGNDLFSVKLFEAASKMKSLEKLMSFGAALEDSHLGQLGRLKRLRWLALRGSPVTFESFPRLPMLRHLEADATLLTTRGLRSILENPSLQYLSIADTPIPAAELIAFDWQSHSLEEITIGYLEASKEELSALLKRIWAGCPKIRNVFVNNGEVWMTGLGAVVRTERILLRDPSNAAAHDPGDVPNEEASGGSGRDCGTLAGMRVCLEREEGDLHPVSRGWRSLFFIPE